MDICQISFNEHFPYSNVYDSDSSFNIYIAIEDIDVEIKTSILKGNAKKEITNCT